MADFIGSLMEGLKSLYENNEINPKYTGVAQDRFTRTPILWSMEPSKVDKVNSTRAYYSPKIDSSTPNFLPRDRGTINFPGTISKPGEEDKITLHHEMIHAATIKAATMEGLDDPGTLAKVFSSFTPDMRKKLAKLYGGNTYQNIPTTELVATYLSEPRFKGDPGRDKVVNAFKEPIAGLLKRMITNFEQDAPNP